MDVLEPKYYAAIGMVMTLIAVIFLFLMGSALVHSTKSFWQGYSTELSCDTEKKLQQLDMEAILKIPNITIPDMGVIMELQKNTKSGKLFSYLGGGSDEATKMRGKENEATGE